MNPISFSPSIQQQPSFGAKRKRTYAQIEGDKAASRHRTMANRRAEQHAEMKNNARYRPATLVDFEADPETGAMRQTGQMAAIFDKRRQHFTGFTASPSGKLLVVAEETRPASALILPGAEAAARGIGKKIILPDDGDDSIRASRHQLSHQPPANIIRLDDPASAEDTSLDTLLMQVHDTHRRQNSSRPRRRL